MPSLQRPRLARTGVTALRNVQRHRSAPDLPDVQHPRLRREILLVRRALERRKFQLQTEKKKEYR